MKFFLLFLSLIPPVFGSLLQNGNNVTIKIQLNRSLKCAECNGCSLFVEWILLV